LSGSQSASASAEDQEPPEIFVVSAGGAVYTSSVPNYSVVGRAFDNYLTVTEVTWSNDRGGSGVCIGTNPWMVTITLQPGTNILTFTAYDLAGNSASTWITVIYTAPPRITIRGSNTLLPPS